MRKFHLLALAFCLTLSFTNALSLPGQATTPQAAGVPNLLMRSDEADKLVFINGVKVGEVEPFTSQAGKKHLRFKMTVAGTTYPAVMFEGDWKPADQTNLAKGNVHLLGVWGTFGDKPSFTAMRVFTQPIKPDPKAPKGPQNVMIRDAQILVSTITEFTSSAKKVHLTYSFTVNGKTYQAIIYSQNRTPEFSKFLRSGKATLYGTWAEYNGKPSFVTERVSK